MFAANPVSNPVVTNTTIDDYSAAYVNNWNMLFGKKLTTTDFVPMIDNIVWTTNTAYARYDNTKDLSNSQYFACVEPATVGGYYHIYKCIDNANGATSTIAPDLQQLAPFTKADGYTWKYMYSISSSNYKKMATEDYIPVYANTQIATQAYNYSGLDVVVINNPGSGYNVYNDGTVRFANSSAIQIDEAGLASLNYYKDSGLYIFNSNSATGQLFSITASTGRYVYTNAVINTTSIEASATEYKIFPQVVFDTDGEAQPKAYSTINTFSNSIANVVIVDTGYGISRATATIVSNSSYGSGASVYCIVNPPGGHGANPAVELRYDALGISGSFNKSESGNLPVDVLYNKVGIIRSPSTLNSNGSKGSAFTSNTFNAMSDFSVFPSMTYTVGTTVVGNTSGAKGTVAFSNSSTLYLVGDKTFSNGEYVYDSSNNQTQITINTLGDIYTKDLLPLYIQNIADIARSNSHTETFKIVIQI
jgi:hypothetical protein